MSRNINSKTTTAGYLSGELGESKSASFGSKSRQEWLTFLALWLSPIVYLSVRHGIHGCLFFLVLLAVFDMAKNPRKYLHGFDEPWIKPLLLALVSIFLATAVTQTLRLKLHWPSFDGPSRILLAALVFCFLRTQAVSFAKVLEVGLPLGLLALFLAIRLYPDTNPNWEGRYATYFVDPNSLGSQSLILTVLCLSSIRLFGKEAQWLLVLKVIGVAIGIHITIHAQSRGGWLAIPPLLLLWVILYFVQTKETRAIKYGLPIVLLCAAIAALVLGYEYSTIISGRVNYAYEDITNWLTGTNLEGAAGRRLSIWRISLALAQDSPWFGYGETGFNDILSNHPLNTSANHSAVDTLIAAGPHSDILAKLLSMGLIGVLAYLATLAVPWAFFWARRADARVNVQAASHLGMYFVTGVFICGIANEMLSLKYLCSFYGLMIAGLASDITKRIE